MGRAWSPKVHSVKQRSHLPLPFSTGLIVCPAHRPLAHFSGFLYTFLFERSLNKPWGSLRSEPTRGGQAIPVAPAHPSGSSPGSSGFPVVIRRPLLLKGEPVASCALPRHPDFHGAPFCDLQLERLSFLEAELSLQAPGTLGRSTACTTRPEHADSLRSDR